jgi:hypothetical protein
MKGARMNVKIWRIALYSCHWKFRNQVRVGIDGECVGWEVCLYGFRVKMFHFELSSFANQAQNIVR